MPSGAAIPTRSFQAARRRPQLGTNEPKPAQSSRFHACRATPPTRSFQAEAPSAQLGTNGSLLCPPEEHFRHDRSKPHANVPSLERMNHSCAIQRSISDTIVSSCTQTTPQLGTNRPKQTVPAPAGPHHRHDRSKLKHHPSTQVRTNGPETDHHRPPSQTKRSKLEHLWHSLERTGRFHALRGRNSDTIVPSRTQTSPAWNERTKTGPIKPLPRLPGHTTDTIVPS